MTKRLLTAVALLATVAFTCPACSSESGDRATTDAPAGTNEPGTTTTDRDDATGDNGAGMMTDSMGTDTAR